MRKMRRVPVFPHVLTDRGDEVKELGVGAAVSGPEATAGRAPLRRWSAIATHSARDCSLTLALVERRPPNLPCDPKFENAPGHLEEFGSLVVP